jgi:hypothetical protein
MGSGSRSQVPNPVPQKRIPSDGQNPGLEDSVLIAATDGTGGGASSQVQTERNAAESVGFFDGSATLGRPLILGCIALGKTLKPACPSPDGLLDPPKNLT